MNPLEIVLAVVFGPGILIAAVASLHAMTDRREQEDEEEEAERAQRTWDDINKYLSAHRTPR